MATSLLKGTDVVDAATGKRLGRVHAVYLDPSRREVAGFTLRRGRVFWRTRPGLVDMAGVTTFGPSAVVVAGRTTFGASARDPERAGLIALDDLTRRPVRLDDGTSLGRIAAVRFSQESRRLTGLEVDPDDRALCRLLIDADQIVRLGPNAVVVRDRAAAAPRPSLTPPLPIRPGAHSPRRVA
jgi:uncharacterized protein YrrD